MKVKWQQWETALGWYCVPENGLIQTHLELEQTLPSSGSQPCTSQLGMPPHRTGAMNCQVLQTAPPAAGLRKLSRVLPILRILLSEPQCNCALWEHLGPWGALKSPSGSPPLLDIDSCHTEDINPSLVSCEKDTHSRAAFLLLSWDFFPCKWTDETPELPCCLWWCTTPVCTVVLCYCYSFW